MKRHAISDLVILMPSHLASFLRMTKYTRDHSLRILKHKGGLVDRPSLCLARLAIIQGLL
ncbi:hypothetical protein ACFL6U_26000 [Planctomycetota bacterium]